MIRSLLKKGHVKMVIGAAMVIMISFSLSIHAIAQNPARLMMGTTSTASSHYAYCVAASNAINTISGDVVRVTAVATGGGVDNLERLDRKQIDFGIGTFDAFYQAYAGIGEYKGDARPNLRILYLYSVNANNFIVRADSRIETLQQLNERRFCPGLRGSSGEQLVEQMLNVVGIEPNYFRGGLSDAVDAVKDNRIVGLAKSGAGLDLDGSTQELRAFTRIRILDWPEEKREKIRKEMPFVVFAKIPANTNPGQGEYTTPVQSIGMVTNKDSLTNEQVYAILKGVHEERAVQEASYPAVKGFDFGKETIAYGTFPMHAGAVKYFRDAGYTIPEHLVPPEMR